MNPNLPRRGIKAFSFLILSQIRSQNIIIVNNKYRWGILQSCVRICRQVQAVQRRQLDGMSVIALLRYVIGAHDVYEF